MDGIEKVINSLDLQNRADSSDAEYIDFDVVKIEKDQLGALDRIENLLIKLNLSVNRFFSGKILKNISTKNIETNRIYSALSSMIINSNRNGAVSMMTTNRNFSSVPLINNSNSSSTTTTNTNNAPVSQPFNSPVGQPANNPASRPANNQSLAPQLPDVRSFAGGIVLKLLPQKVIKSYVAGIQKLIDELSKIQTNDVEKVLEPISKLGTSLSSFANINLIGSFASLAKLQIFVKGLKVFFKNAGSGDNLDGLKNIKLISDSLTPLKTISDSLKDFADIKWAKILFSSASLKLFLNTFSKLKTDTAEKTTSVLKKIADGIKVPLEKLGNSLEAFGKSLNKFIGPLIKGALAITLLGASLIPLAYGLKMFADVSWENIAKGTVALGGLALLAKVLGSTAGVLLKGAGAIALLGLSIMPLAYSLKMMENVGIGTIGVLAAGLTTLGIAAAALGSFFPLIAIGALGIGLLGASIIPLAYGLKMLAEVNPEILSTLAGSIIKLGGALALASSGLLIGGLAMIPFAGAIKLLSSAVGDSQSMSDFFDRFGNFVEKINPQKLFDTAKAIASLSAAIAAFGAAQAAEGLGNLVGKFLRFGSDSPLEQMQKFADISAPLDIAGKAIGALADGIGKLSEMSSELSVLTNFPFDKLEDLAEEIEGKAIIQIILNGNSTESKVIDQNSSEFSKMTEEQRSMMASNSYLSQDITPVPSSIGSTLSAVGPSGSAGNTIVVNNNNGGNVNNVSSSNVNNTSAAPAPIMTGSAMSLF